MPPAWFLLTLFSLNLCASVTFALHGQLAWSVIYAGAALIQAGSYWVTR